MKRWLRLPLSIINLHKALGAATTFSVLKNDYQLDHVKVDFKNALVLSPHPDDEALGAGGTIKKLSSSGVNVTVAYFCDGSSGTIDGHVDKSLIEKRKKEAKTSAGVLGISDQVFFGYPDGKLASGNSSIRALLDLIGGKKPDIIILPSFLDNHFDHRVTNEILINAASGKDMDEIPIWGYEIWSPTFINRLSDISLYIKTKKEAIFAHESQLACRAYDKAVLALNQYRAEINGTGDYAEGFIVAPFKIYKELYKKS